MFFFAQILVNSTITSGMTFTKTSQKFGQWSDAKVNTIYGLGFASESDLKKVKHVCKVLLYIVLIAIADFPQGRMSWRSDKISKIKQARRRAVMRIKYTGRIGRVVLHESNCFHPPPNHFHINKNEVAMIILPDLYFVFIPY